MGGLLISTTTKEANAMKTIELKETLTLTYSVDKCSCEQFNGTHTEVFDLSSLTKDDIEQYLAQTLIIKRQGMLRSKTADEKVQLGTWPVPAPGKRISTDPIQKVTDMLAKLTPEQKALLIASLSEA